jgi:competence protein ComEA
VRPGRTGLLALGLLLLLGVGTWRALRWPAAGPALDCPPEEVRSVGGVARCLPAQGEPLPGGQALTVGQKLVLNRATAEELALVPGVGPRLARALVEERERQGGFSDWDQVEAVRGVGPVKLQALMQAAELDAQGPGPQLP